MNEPSSAAIEHFNRASEARSNKNFDLAITEFDACLSSSPNAEMTFFALCYCWEIIFDRFDFFNRDGASLSDYEVAWTLRAQSCLNKAIEIYELYYNSFTDDKADMSKQYYLGTRDRRNEWLPYGGMKYDANGEKQLRDFEIVQGIKLPPLKGLDSVLTKSQEKSSSEFDLEKLLSEDPTRHADHIWGKAVASELKYELNFENSTVNEKINLLEETVALYDKAIKLGLPQKTLVESYGSAGIALCKIAGFKGEFKLLESSNWQSELQNLPYARRANQYLEYALSLDSQTGGSVFGNTSPRNDSLPTPDRSELSDMLFWLDTLLSFQCDSLRNIEGDKSVIPFVLEKSRNVAYLKFLPFPNSCIELAKSFYNIGDTTSAIHWLNCIVSDSEDFADLKSHSSESRRRTKEEAQNKIAAYSADPNEAIDSEQSINKSRYSGISLAAAVGAFILSLLIPTILFNRSGRLDCCFPVIVAVVVYFVTPPIMNLLHKR